MTIEVLPQEIFGRRLQEIREAAGLTGAQLAAILRQQEHVIEDLERGAESVSAVQLWEICAALNVKPYEFFEYK